jgi:hypothetical protein
MISSVRSAVGEVKQYIQKEIKEHHEVSRERAQAAARAKHQQQYDELLAAAELRLKKLKRDLYVIQNHNKKVEALPPAARAQWVKHNPIETTLINHLSPEAQAIHAAARPTLAAPRQMRAAPQLMRAAPQLMQASAAQPRAAMRPTLAATRSK